MKYTVPKILVDSNKKSKIFNLILICTQNNNYKFVQFLSMTFSNYINYYYTNIKSQSRSNHNN